MSDVGIDDIVVAFIIGIIWIWILAGLIRR